MVCNSLVCELQNRDLILALILCFFNVLHHEFFTLFTGQVLAIVVNKKVLLFLLVIIYVLLLFLVIVILVIVILILRFKLRFNECLIDIFIGIGMFCLL